MGDEEPVGRRSERRRGRLVALFGCSRYPRRQIDSPLTIASSVGTLQPTVTQCGRHLPYKRRVDRAAGKERGREHLGGRQTKSDSGAKTTSAIGLQRPRSRRRPAERAAQRYTMTELRKRVIRATKRPIPLEYGASDDGVGRIGPPPPERACDGPLFGQCHSDHAGERGRTRRCTHRHVLQYSYPADATRSRLRK